MTAQLIKAKNVSWHLRKQIAMCAISIFCATLGIKQRCLVGTARREAPASLVWMRIFKTLQKSFRNLLKRGRMVQKLSMPNASHVNTTHGLSEQAPVGIMRFLIGFQ